MKATLDYKKKLVKKLQLYTTWNCEDIQILERVYVGNTLTELLHNILSNAEYMLYDVEPILQSEYPFTISIRRTSHKLDDSYVVVNEKYKFAVKKSAVEKLDKEFDTIDKNGVSKKNGF